MRVRDLALPLTTLVLFFTGPVSGQGLKLAAGDFGLGVGDVPRLDGIRLNFRDRHLDRVRGLNLTLWEPHDDAVGGSVQGVAVGLPVTGARRISGLSLGAGVSAEEDLSGIGVGVFGVAAGRRLTGIMVGGLGMAAGEDVRGVMIGGLGSGTGGSARGLLIGGLGAGVGEDVRGIALGGLGVGAGRDFSGLGIGGLGIGSGGSARGILIGGIGVGAATDVEGLAIGGVGVGAGGEIRGIAIALAGVGASSVTGLAVAAAAGGRDINALVIAPLHFKALEDGTMRGVSLSAFNRTQGRQNGLTIGILNIADELHGIQIGLVNIARNKARYRVLPLVNWN